MPLQPSENGGENKQFPSKVKQPLQKASPDSDDDDVDVDIGGYAIPEGSA